MSLPQVAVYYKSNPQNIYEAHELINLWAGHLFCHTCLMEALIAGENQGFEPGKGQSKCPVCRKRVKRPSGRRSEALSMLTMEMKVNKRPNTVKEKNKEPIAAPKAPFISPPRSVSGKIYVKRR